MEQVRHEAIDRHLEQAFWPWGLALAYCQSPQHRDAAVAAVVEVIDTYTADVKGALRYCGAACLHRIFEAVEGEAHSSVDWSRFATIERRLLGPVQAGSIDTFGKRTEDASLEPIAVLDWVGGEIDGDATCDLVKAGWRSTGLLERALGDDRVVRFYDIYLHGGAVRQLVDALDNPRLDANPAVVFRLASDATQLPQPAFPSARGRKAGKGGYSAADAPLVEEMKALLDSKEATAPWDAAGKVASRAKGAPTNAQTRLTDRFYEAYPEYR